tara:strand:- start:1212 stop:1574 length:363 start_codon:yes stop_codon:yes gene_type:complete
MPDLLICEKCSKHFLSAKYAWTPINFICKKCEELSNEEELKISINTLNENNNIEKNSNTYINNIEDGGILITWDFVLKVVISGGICILLFMLINKNRVNTPNKEISSDISIEFEVKKRNS